MLRHDVCVLVRMYNEAARVGHVVYELKQIFAEVICVDDGSTDDSAQVARQAGATVVRHPFNLGGGAAMGTALEVARRHSSATWLITFDADGQHRVEDALNMLAIAEAQNVDVALATRFKGQHVGMPRSRRLVLLLATWFTRITTRMPVSDTHNGLRVFHRRVLDRIVITHAGMAYASEILGSVARNRLTWTEVPVTILYDQYSVNKGQSNLNAINILFDLTMARIRATQ